MFCPHCGCELPDDAQFCGNCGEKLPGSGMEYEVQENRPSEKTVREKPKQKGSFGKIAVIVGAVALVLIVGAVLVSKLGGEPDEPVAVPQATDQPQAVQQTETTAEAVEPTTSQPQTAEADGLPPVTDPASRPVNEPVGGLALSTSAMPEDGDFFWYLNDVEMGGVQDGVLDETDFNQVVGGWKCLFIYDWQGISTGRMYDFLNLTLSGAEGNSSIILDWGYMYAEGERFDESDMEDTVLNVNWDNGKLYASGAVNLTIERFYSYYGSQFAIGSLTLQDGTEGHVALMRP